MAASISAHLTDWEEFHRRFEGVDWAAINEVTEEEFSVELVCGHEEGEDLSCAEAERGGEALEKLHSMIAQFHSRAESKLFWRRILWWRPKALPLPEDNSLPLEDNLVLLQDMLHWVEEAEFVFRLSPRPFKHPSERYRDSPIDFSFFHSEGVEVDTVSPTSIRAIAQHLPSPLLEKFLELRFRIEGGQSDKYFGDIDPSLDFWRGIVEKAENGGKGLCIIVG